MASPSLSPSEENHRNEEVEEASMVLNRAMNKTEQTYEQFMEDFVFLKPGDVRKKKHAESNYLPVSKSPSQPSVTVSEKLSKSVQGKNDSRKMPTQQEEIDEEVLVEGSTSSRMNVSTAVRTGAPVQFDNFVEAEEVDEGMDTDYTMTGYAASFTQADKQTSHNKCLADISELHPDSKTRNSQSDGNTKSSSVDPHEMLLSTLSASDNLTDQLLSNFLADLQNESNQTTSNKHETKIAGNSDDIEQFLKQRKKQSTDDNVNFNDNDSDAALTLLDHSEEHEVKITIKPEEMEGISVEDSKNTKHERRANVYKESLMDSEGNIIVSNRAEAVASDSDSVTVEGELVFPGEVPVTEHVGEEMKNETILDFKATLRNPVSGADGDKEMCHNDVVPFSLDENFDYDNVVLTPKYSSEDLKKLRT